MTLVTLACRPLVIKKSVAEAETRVYPSRVLHLGNQAMSLNAIATPAAREPGPLVTRWRSLTVARKFHRNAVRSLPEERAAEIAARTLALPGAQSVEDLTALLTSSGERRGADSYRSRTA